MTVQPFARLVAMWVGRAIGAALIVFAVCLWIFTPSPNCNPMRLFGCGLLDIGIAGVIGSSVRWLVISVIGALGVALWQWKPRLQKTP
jgi:hypothetical protein